MSDMVRLTGLWKKQAKDGSRFLTGKLGGARVFVFLNQDKRGESSPDATLCIATDQDGARNRDRPRHVSTAEDRFSRELQGKGR